MSLLNHAFKRHLSKSFNLFNGVKKAAFSQSLKGSQQTRYISIENSNLNRILNSNFNSIVQTRNISKVKIFKL